MNREKVILGSNNANPKKQELNILALKRKIHILYILEIYYGIKFLEPF